MKHKRVVSTLIITIFTTTSLFAGPCIDCVSSAFTKDSTNQESRTQWSAKSIIKNDNSKEYIDSMIALDDNDYNNKETPIVVNESENLYENEIPKLIEEYPTHINIAKTLYACDDIINNIVACDDENKEECECV